MSAPALPPLDWGFLRRTVVATVVTTLLVGLFSTVYVSPGWGGRYLFFSLWATVFFSLSGLIFRYLLFETRRSLGFMLLGLKLVCLVLLFVIPPIWPTSGPMFGAQVAAIFMGISTPLFVLVLRVLGSIMEHSRRGGRNPAPRLSVSGSSHPKSGEARPHP